MRLFRARIGAKDFSESIGVMPSCVVKIKNFDRRAIHKMLEAAFGDDPILSDLIRRGNVDLQEIDLTTEGIA